MSRPLVPQFHVLVAATAITLGAAACTNPGPEALMTRHAQAVACTPSTSVSQQPAPVPDPAALQLLSRTERMTIPVRRDYFTAWFAAAPLERLLPGAAGIPAVTGTRPLSAKPFPEPGSRRLVCLADESTALEEVLEHEPGRRLRYIVWDYSTQAAVPIAYGVGEFRFADAGAGTNVTWTYAFQLKEDRFPGSLGALGRGVFRLAFLDTRYAKFMQAGVEAITREGIAAQQADGPAEWKAASRGMAAARGQ